MLDVVERATSKTAYACLPKQVVIKGAATRPESFEEVAPHLDSWLGPKVVLCGDGAQSWNKYSKSRGLGPTASASHQQKEYVSIKKIPAPPGSSAAWLLSEMGHPEKKVLRVKGGDQRAEATIGAVKNVLRRRCQLRSVVHADTNALAAAFNRESPGLRALAEGVAVFLNIVVDKQNPTTYWVGPDQKCPRASVMQEFMKLKKRPASGAKPVKKTCRGGKTSEKNKKK